MPQYLWQYRLFLWMLMAWVSSKVANADIPAFGMRLKPIHKAAPTLRNPTSCPTCHSKTIENYTQVHRTETKLDLLNRLDQIDSDGRVSEPKLKIGNYYRTEKPSIKSQETAPSPKDNSKKGATFFFTQVEPHRFEYRAMFQHHRNIENPVFQPFVHDFNSFSKDFPPLPKFPLFPSFPDFFPDHKDPFPNFNEFSFPTLPPAIKRAWQPPNDLPMLQKPIMEEKFETPVMKDYDIVLGHTRYPKIFRFNEERINIEEFDRQKKLRFYSLGQREQNELLEPENVKRDHLLILHGGIFTVQEPPLFNKHKKRRKTSAFRSYRTRI